jgi:MFS transporter, DHA1 family, multidrug resistance protein
VPRTSNRAALLGILGAIFVSSTGIGSLLPVLPLYLRERNASFALVGVIVGSALVAQALGQWPAGRLAERVGRREMMVAGLTVAGIASVAFVLPLPVEWLIVLRVAQGLGFAAAAPAELAAVGDIVPPEQLGRAYAWVSGCQMAGFIAGPAIGGLLAVFGRWAVFTTTGVALFVAAIVVAVTLRFSVHQAATPNAITGLNLFGRTRMEAAVRSIAVISIGLGLLIGIYDVIWSLFMRSLNASDPVIGISFTLFALPFLIATPLAGWIADRWDRRWVAVGSVILGSLIGPFYPLLKDIPVVMIVGAGEATTWAFNGPAMNAFLMDAVPSRRAEAQGLVGTAQSAATAVGSLVGGWLFGVGIGVPFYVAATGGVLFAVLAIPGLRSAGQRAPVSDQGSQEPGRERSETREREGSLDAR